MAQSPKLKVLVVDDSIVYRELIRRGLGSDPGIEVIATAKDPYEARDKILLHQPDVMTCDVEMPRMNGITFIRKLLPQYAIPVIVVSSVSEAVLDAMQAGAIDFVVKPDMTSARQVEQFIRGLIVKVKTGGKANVSSLKSTPIGERYAPVPVVNSAVNSTVNSGKIIVVGSSTGGTEAIYRILSALPEHMPGIVVVQHMPPVFTRMYADRLNATTPFHVKEAESGDAVVQGKVLIAPGDKHVRLRKAGNRYWVECFAGEKVNGHCPSVDVLFESAAREAGPQAIGLLLSGMGYDGARGLLAMKRKGARTIGQNERSSVVYGMPKVAYELGAVEKQADLADMPRVLLSVL